MRSPVYYRARHRQVLGRTKVRAALLAAALVGGTLAAPALPLVANATEPATLSGTVLMPDGRTPAPAAVLRLARVDAAGLPIADSAFAQGVTDLDGHFTIDPFESDTLLTDARANGGELAVAVVVGKLAGHGTLVPPADATRTADVATFAGVTALRLADGSTGPAFTFADTRPADLTVPPSRPYIAPGAALVLHPAEPVESVLTRIGTRDDLPAAVAAVGAFTDLHAFFLRLPNWTDTVVNTLPNPVVLPDDLVALVGNAVGALSDLAADYTATVQRGAATAAVYDATVAYLSWAQATLNRLAQQVIDTAGTAGLDAVLAQVDALADTADMTAQTTRMFNDPDLVAGNDTLDDPDLIPPLGAVLSVIPVTDLYDANPVGVTGLRASTGGGGTESSPGFDSTGCYHKNDREVHGTKQPDPKVRMDVWLSLFSCTDYDHNPSRDFWAWAWDGKVTNVDDSTAKRYVWRFKFRTDLDHDFDYKRYGDGSPEGGKDIKTSGETSIPWYAEVTGGSGVAGTFGVSGHYTVVKAKKIHPWADDENRLYHVSWMSNNNVGSRDAYFKNGGGNMFLVPQGTDFAHAKISANNQIYVWTCSVPLGNNGSSTECTPR